MEFKKENIVFGCWPISGDYGYKSNKKSINLIKKVINFGIYEFDTAPNYGGGNAENLLGNLNAKYKKKIKINTKIGNSIKNIKSFDINFLKKNFNESLSRLKVKKINILFLHNPRTLRNEKVILNYFNDLKKKKIIAKIGLSLANDFKYSQKFISQFDVIQYDYNLLCQKKFLKNFKINKIKYKRSIFGSGTMTEKFLNKNIKFKKKDQRSKWLNFKRINLIKYHLNEIKKITKKNISQTAFTFAKKKLNKNKIIVGFRTLKNFKDFLKMYNEDMLENHFKAISQYYTNHLIKYDKRPLV